jgi:hypothetical protein
MKTLIAILALTLAGCATQYAAHQNDPDFHKAYAECDLESMKVTGTDSMDIAWNQGAYMGKCLRHKGYKKY